MRFRRRGGYSSNPPSSAGGSGGEDQVLTAAAGTEIGSSGKVTTGSSSAEIILTIDSGQAAMASGPISGAIGAVYWDQGSVVKGPCCARLEWVSKINLTNVFVVVFRAASAPTSLADIQGATAVRYLQARTSAAGGVSTFIQHNASSNVASTNNENKASSLSIAYSVAVDDAGMGPHMSRHYYSATGTTGRTNATTTNANSGNIYIALLWGKTASSASSQEQIKLKLSGGMPVS